MGFVLLKRSYLTNFEAHFAGGKHAFSSMARTLALTHRVHVVFVSTKADALVHASYHGLTSVQQSQAGSLTWTDKTQENLRCHAVLTDQSLAGSGHYNNDSCVSAQLAEIELISASYSRKVALIIDADEAQLGSAADSQDILSSMCEHFPGKVFILVQNVHFLPFGPSGTSRRTESLIKAWNSAAGVMCVSKYVATYVEHWTKQENMVLTNVHVVPLSAWGVFGEPPFRDFGATAAVRLASGCAPPVVGVLKLTPEKGAAIIFALAKQLPHVKFLAVAGHPTAKEYASAFPNVEVISPRHDIDEVLKDVDVVLVPSVWIEAFGMVVVESMLRGIPVVVSDSGALPEAAMGTGLVVPTAQIVIPVDAETSTPDWSRREYPKQDVQHWVTAVVSLLSNVDSYLHHSRAARDASHKFLANGPLHLQAFLLWVAAAWN